MMYSVHTASRVGSRVTRQLYKRGGQIRGLSSASDVIVVPHDDMRGKYNQIERLPIPDFDETMARYKLGVDAMASLDGEMDGETRENDFKLMQDFIDTGKGKELWEAVVKIDQSNAEKGSYPHSYIESHWDDMYLGGRWSLPINSNPFYLLRGSKTCDAPSSYSNTGSIVSSMLRWGRKVRDYGLEADGGCMSSFPYMVGGCRVPGVGRDELRMNPNWGHIVVCFNNAFFRIEAACKATGRVYDGAYFSSKLKEIVERGEGGDEAFMGYGTGLGRDEWASLRGKAEGGDELSKSSIDCIDSAALVVCLDKEDRGMTEDMESERMLHGEDGGNRWYDKHCLVRLGSGRIGYNFEHSFSDGMVWNRMIEEVMDDVRGEGEGKVFKRLEEGIGGEEGGVERLEWGFGAEVEEELRKAKAEVEGNCGGCESSFLDFDMFGKGEIKKWKVSPDAALQMSYQLAYSHLHPSSPPVTYESCATRSFFRGRTETIRSLSVASASFVQTMREQGSSREARRDAFVKACGRHIELAKEAKGGMGVDRIFLAMRKAGGHPFFETETFKKSANFVLSTSNVTSTYLDRFGFGAVTGEGYGLGYLVHEDNVPINITAFGGGGTNTRAMKKAIKGGMVEIKDLF
ncbi:hypothetical protein TrCOL_g1510 [Triparma columacea]|uniref:Choline/carnitine acyltransferase domain-containing protein n=1 Tax=Triparma columacea TaxID=722753 RepID=A0A9W7GIB0_9STRA|nr:hypothetical protein TrCOL_g1510 [Triparma columacea]